MLKASSWALFPAGSDIALHHGFSHAPVKGYMATEDYPGNDAAGNQT